MKQIRIWFALLALLSGIGIFFFFYLAYPYHLEHREQMLLFTYTWEQFSSYLNHPAALACLVGDFFTQFFHLKVVGPLIVAAALVKLEVMAFFTFRKWMNQWVAVLLALIVVVWEGLRFCDAFYPLSGTAALIGGFFLFLCVCRIKGNWSFLAAFLLGILFGYYFLGYGMLVFAGCMAVELFVRNHRVRLSLASSIGGVLLTLFAAFLPAMTANHFLLMTGKAYSYPATVWKGEPIFDDERTLGLSTEYYHDNWDKVNELVYQGVPSNDASICFNLANAIQGKLPERLMYYYQPAGLALFMPVYEGSTYLSTQLAGEVWYRLGDMTMAEHASILSMIFSPDNKSSRMVKRMAEINLINGEYEAAQKYLNILSNTLFYSDWAKNRMPGHETEEVKQWLSEKRSVLPQQDTLRLSCTDVNISLHNLLKSNPDNAMARDYLLCFDLLMKDLPSFIADYQLYYKERPNRLYSEALMIHLFQKRAKAAEVQASGIHPSVIQDFNHYNQVYNQSQGNAAALQSKFARTYWYYYHFANLK